MIYLSHKAAQVTGISVPDNSSVRAGTSILTLDTIDEDIRLARVSALEELRIILEQRLSDPVLSINRRMAQIAVDTAEALEPIAVGITTLNEIIVKAGGTVTASDAAQAVSTGIPAPFQTTKAKLQQRQFEMQLAESTSVNELIRSHLQIEIQTANALKARATFTALSDGKVYLKMVMGAFVKKGESLFEIV